MKSYFDKETMEFLKDRGNGMVAGQQANFNHHNCPAGIDRKNRLYVKVAEDGKMVLGYCHHCSGRGAVRRFRFSTEGVPKEIDTNNVIFEARLQEYEDAVSLDNVIYMDFVKYFNCKPLCGLLDVLPVESPENDYNLRTLISRNGYHGMRVLLSGDGASYPKVIIPLTGEHGSIDGLLTRRIGHSEHWFVYKKKDVDGSHLCGKMILYNSFNSDTVVICEDVISAMKLDFAGYAGCAMMGSNCDTADLLKLSILFKRCVVWFDNDNTIVREKSRHVVATSRLFFDSSEIVSDCDDPKHYTVPQIKKRIK